MNTSLDFATAQQRAIERRRLREVNHQSHIASQNQRASDAIARFPTPIQGLARSGIEKWNVIKGREGTKPAFRVGQVDAELLDEELIELLKGQVGEALKYFGSHLRDDWSAEILLGLRAFLFKLSIWDHNASYGASLQNLQYTDARHQGVLSIPPSRWQKAVYGIFTVGGRYFWSKWESWLVEQEGGYDEPTANVRLLSRVSSVVVTTYTMASFTSFIVFLLNGRYRTLVDRILGLRLTPPANQVTREVSFEYLNRQLVWHAFTEFLLFLLPLVGISRWKRWLARVWRKIKTIAKRSDDESPNNEKLGGELRFLPERTCAICYQNQNPATTSENEILAITSTSGGVIGSAQTDITNPYQAIPCGCVYCFVCIASKIEAEEGEGWVCLRCGEVIEACKPWAADVMDEIERPVLEKSVSFSNEGEK